MSSNTGMQTFETSATKIHKTELFRLVKGDSAGKIKHKYYIVFFSEVILMY